MKFSQSLILALSCMLAACGGGGDSTSAAPATAAQAPAQGYAVRALVAQTEQPVQNSAFNTSFFAPSGPVAADPVAAVQLQAQTSSQVVIVPSPAAKMSGFAGFYAYADAAAAARAAGATNIFGIYGYDEVGFSAAGINPHLDEDAILAASNYAHAKGLQFVVTMMPNVVLDPAFQLSHPGEYDTIGLDLYPSALLNTNTPGCASQATNVYQRLLECSVSKLRAQGFTGQIWYVPQAFAIKGEDHAQFLANMKLQHDVIAAAPAMGITGIAPYGLYWTTPPDAPYIQGYGSDFQSLVDCSSGC